MVLEMKIIKEELRFEENLKKRLEFICELVLSNSQKKNHFSYFLFEKLISNDIIIIILKLRQ